MLYSLSYDYPAFGQFNKIIQFGANLLYFCGFKPFFCSLQTTNSLLFRL